MNFENIVTKVENAHNDKMFSNLFNYYTIIYRDVFIFIAKVFFNAAIKQSITVVFIFNISIRISQSSVRETDECSNNMQKVGDVTPITYCRIAVSLRRKYIIHHDTSKQYYPPCYI